MKVKEFYEKVDQLRAGQVVEIDGNYFKAKSFKFCNVGDECLVCSLDSLCKGDVAAVCTELPTSKRPHWMLELVGRIK